MPHTDRARLALAAAAVAVLAACGPDEPAETTQQIVRQGDPDAGRAQILEYGCASCHAIPGVPGVEHGVGPDLDNLEDRRYLAGQLPNRPEELIRWLQNPQEIAPGTVMPDMGVTEQDARDIAAYLYEQ
ncbi:hypothetical protein GCM10023169_35660 [Georgenia halophila]|uniref:Cytochrome c domain-containing protein n=1 Tax=Georgenia halophila TaxID=620889 RepID=A0ABP8LLG1_9MICO